MNWCIHGCCQHINLLLQICMRAQDGMCIFATFSVTFTVNIQRLWQKKLLPSVCEFIQQLVALS